MDVWDSQTFDHALRDKLKQHSNLIVAFHQEADALHERHFNSDPYESLQPNKFRREYQSLLENDVISLMKQRRIRVWHYTRLLDDEARSMSKTLEPSTLMSLRGRLNKLIEAQLLTENEADIAYQQSPFHEQEDMRSNRIWSVINPVKLEDGGVEPLLASWGGESAYFWLKDESLAKKLKSIGKPRIVEIETALLDGFNAYGAAETAVQSWAKHLGVPVLPENRDLAIEECLKDAKVLKVHTKGDGIFEAIAKTYPDGCENLLNA